MDAAKMPLALGRRVYVIYPIMVLHFFGLSMVNFVVNEYTQRTVADELYPNVTFNSTDSGCKDSNHTDVQYEQRAHVQEQTAYWTIYYAIATKAPAIVSNAVLTSYTDVYGRRFLFIFTIAGSVAKLGLIAIIMYTKISFAYIVVAFAIDGISGSYISFLSVCFSFMADTTVTNKDRVFAVTIVEACIYTAPAIGIFLNGVLVDKFGFVAPMLLTTGICSLALLITIFALPESLAKSNRHKPSSPFGMLARTVQFYTSSDFKGHRTGYLILLVAFFFIELNANNRDSVETLYLLGMPFCWGPAMIGYFSGLRFFAQGVFGLVFLKLFQLYLSSEAIAILSSLVNAGTFVQEGLARSDVALFLVCVPAMLSFLAIPMIRGIMSNMTTMQKQGSLFASIATVEVTSSLVATVSESGVYAATVAVSNSFVFYVMGGFSLITLLLLGVYWCKEKDSQPPKYEIIQGMNTEKSSEIIHGINTEEKSLESAT